MSRVNTCRICGKNFETEGNHPHRYCPECQAKYKSPKDVAYYLNHKEKHKEFTKGWQKRNPERTREIGQKVNQKRRITILTHYSTEKNHPICALCGEKTIEFLALDHIDNTGGKHRKLLGKNKHENMYKWIEKNGFPNIFQVLCHNCNWRKARNIRTRKVVYICGDLHFSNDSEKCILCMNDIPLQYLKCVEISKNVSKQRYQQQLHMKIKEDVIKHYSAGKMQCACCGNSDIQVLAVDHIYGEGNIQKKKNNIKGGNNFYRWLIKNNYPEGYQVLCYNCNMAKGFYGSCPHQNNQ